MIAKIVTGSDFGGAESYITGKKDAEILHANNLFSENHAEEMAIVASQASIKKPVLHASLSLPNGEYGTKKQWIKATDTFLVKMGFDLDKTQYSLVRHTDSKHDHVHLLVNKVMLDGKVNHLQNGFIKSHEASREAEKAAGFSAYDKQKHQEQKQTNEGQGKMHELRSSISSALKLSNGDYDKFKNELAQKGIKTIEHRQSTGRLSGLSFQKDEGKIFKGSEIGRDYSVTALVKKGLNIETNQNYRDDKKQNNHQKINPNQAQTPENIHEQGFIENPNAGQNYALDNLTDKSIAANERDLIIKKRNEHHM